VRLAALTTLVAVVAIAFLVRTALVLALRTRRPRAADAVDRWWVWAPLVVVLVAITVEAPLLGVVLIAATAFALTRASAVGSPFRPRG
jgi:hypothetical protein